MERNEVPSGSAAVVTPVPVVYVVECDGNLRLPITSERAYFIVFASLGLLFFFCEN